MTRGVAKKGGNCGSSLYNGAFCLFPSNFKLFNENCDFGSLTRMSIMGNAPARLKETFQMRCLPCTRLMLKSDSPCMNLQEICPPTFACFLK